MLTLNSNKEHSSFFFINNNHKSSTNLICKNTSLITATQINEGLDTCSFYTGPSDSVIEQFADSNCISYEGGESCGSVAYAGSESCGSIASSCDSSGCSYSC